MKDRQGPGTPDSGPDETSRPMAGTKSVQRKVRQGTQRNAREQLDFASQQSPVTRHRQPVTNCGSTYIGLLIFIAIMGIALAGTGMVWHTQVRREKERELLFVGDQFRRAIGRYYELSPGGDKRFPQVLDDLLLDKRYPATQRYLRRVYPDPITNKAEWGFVKGQGDRIVGVYSLSEDVPLKQAGFPASYEQFEDKARYNEWQFTYVPVAPANQPELQPAPVSRKD